MCGDSSLGFVHRNSTRCVNTFIENGNLLKKVAFPKICLPAIVTGSCPHQFFYYQWAFSFFPTVHWPISRDCFTGDNSSSCHSDSLRSKSRDFSWNRECFFSGCWAGLRYSVPILVLVYPFGLPSQHCPGTLSKPSGVKPDGPDYGGISYYFFRTPMARLCISPADNPAYFSTSNSSPTFLPLPLL